MNSIDSGNKPEPDSCFPPGEDDALDKVVSTLLDIDIVCSFLLADFT